MCVLGVCKDYIFSINLGNSRLYAFHNQKLSQLTKDRTVAYDLFEEGIIGYSEINSHEMSNVLTTYLGVGKLEREWIEYNKYDFLVDSSTLFLLCSDGITDYVEDSIISSVLATGDGLETKARKLVDYANSKGGNDNEIVVIVHPYYL